MSLATRLRRGQSGAISVLTAAATLALIASLTMAVDIGSRTLATRDLQGSADMAALDAVRALGDLPSHAPTGLAERSLAENSGWVDPSLKSLQVGTYDPATGTFSPGGANPDAVHVTARGEAPGFVLLGDGEIERSAIARVPPPISSISVGSTLASLDSGDSPVLNALVGGMLGGSVDLSVVSYQGLASTGVALGPLATRLGLASATQLASAEVGLGELLQATADVLAAEGDPLAAQVQDMALAVDPTLPPVEVGDILRLPVDEPGRAADARVRALDLITAAAQAANTNHALTLDLGAGVPGVLDSTVTLTVIEPPQMAVGPARKDPATGNWVTVAETAQIRADLSLDLDPSLLSALGLDIAELHLPLSIDAAQAESALTDITCATPESASTATVETTTRTAGLFLGDRDADGNLSRAELLKISLVLDVVTVTGKSSTTVATGGPRAKTVSGPYPRTWQEPPGGSSVGLADVLEGLDLSADLLGLLPVSLDTIASTMDTALTPVLQGLESAVVGPLLRLLGVRLGTADVWVNDVGCGRRQLVG